MKAQLTDEGIKPVAIRSQKFAFKTRSFGQFLQLQKLNYYLKKQFEKIFSSEVISIGKRSIWAEWGQFEVISDILRHPCVLMGGIFKALYVRLSDFFLISSGSPIHDSLSLICQNILGLWIFFILNIWRISPKDYF